MRFPLLLAALLLPAWAPPARAAPGAQDLEAAATHVAGVLDGVLRNCPASYAKVGTPAKRCVGAASTVEQVRVKLVAALKDDLHGVWRSKDEQRSVYNWLRTPGGFVYVRLQPDPDGRAETLVYLDLPPEAVPAQAAAGTDAGASAPVVKVVSETGTVTITAPRPAETPKPAPATPPAAAPPAAAAPAETPKPASPAPAAPPAAKPAPVTSTTTTMTTTMAPVPFRRVLDVRSPRMNGADVLAVQNRLIALTLGGAGPARGDGWYGPVTAATVRAFQAANGLPVTGRVDAVTWRRLFSDSARPFRARDVALP